MGTKFDFPAMEARVMQIESLNFKAFEVFRLWTKRAKQKFPNWMPELEHENDIVNDIVAQFKEAAKTLSETKNISNDGYAIGYFIGISIGSLSVTWSIRYLPKHQIYYEALWLKSLRQFFEVSEEATMKLNRIYTLYERSNTLFSQHNEDESDFMEYYKFIADENFESQKVELQALLNDLEMKYMTKFVKNQEHISPEDLDKVFTDKDFEFVIWG